MVSPRQPSNSHDALYARFESLRTLYQPLHAEFDIDRAYVEGRYGGDMVPSDWADPSLKPTIPPTAKDAIDNAADHILTFPRTFVTPRAVETDMLEAAMIAEKQRAFHAMWWDRVFLEDDPLGVGKKSLIEGMLVLKLDLRWDLIPEIDNDGPDDAFRRRIARVSRNNFLWRMRAIPKETVYPDPDDTWNPSYVYEEYEATYESVKKCFPDEIPSWMSDVYEADPYSKVKVVEMWSLPSGPDRGKYIVWVEGVRIHDTFNPYSWETPDSSDDSDEDKDYTGRLPYLIGDPGFGYIDKDNKPESKFVSIIRAARSVIVAEARFLTELESWLRMYVWPTLLTRNMPDNDDNPIRLGPGGHIDRTAEQEAEVMSWGEAPASLLQGLQRVNSYVDQTSKFSTLGGVAQRGVDTATEADQNVRNASTKLSGLVNMMRRMCIRANAYVLMDIENVIEVPVTITGATANTAGEVTLRPSDINGYYMTAVELETSDEAMLDMRKARTWTDLYRMLPGLSEEIVMQKIGIDNPIESQDKRAVEDLLRSMPAEQVQLMMFLNAVGDIAGPVKDAFANTIQTRLSDGKTPPALNSADQLTEAASGAPGAPGDSAAAAQAQAMASMPERQLQ